MSEDAALISIDEIKEMMLADPDHRFIPTKNDMWGTPMWRVTDKTGKGRGRGLFGFAVCEFSKDYPKPQSMSYEVAEKMLLDARGELLTGGYECTVSASGPSAVKSMMEHSASQIALKTESVRRHSAVIDAAYMCDLFEYRKRIAHDTFPKLDLPCETYSAVTPVIKHIYEGAILMGRSLTYPASCTLDYMLRFARMGCTVLQYIPDFSRLYPPSGDGFQQVEENCWIIPNGIPAVYSSHVYADPNGTGQKYLREQHRIRPLKDVVVARIGGRHD